MDVYELILVAGMSLLGSYVGVKVAIAEIRVIAKAAQASAQRAHERIDALLQDTITNRRR